MWERLLEEILKAPVELALRDEADRDLLRAVASGNGWPLAGPCLQREEGIRRPGRRGTRRLKIILSVGLAGFPEEARWLYPATLDLRWEGGRWEITGWEWARIPPWALMPGRPWISERFVFITPREFPGRQAGWILGRLEAFREEIEGRLPPEARRPGYLVVWAPNPRLYAEMVGAPPASRAATLYTTRPIRRDGQVIGCRPAEPIVVLNGANLEGDLARRSRRLKEVLRHELVHAALAGWQVPWRPIWLVEGAATFYARQRFWQRLAREDARAIRVLAKHILKSVYVDFFSPRQAFLEMAVASAMAEFVHERYGGEVFFALYKSFAEAPAEVVRRHAGDPLAWSQAEQIAWELTPTLLQQHLGVREEELLDAFANWVLPRLSGARKRPAGR